MSKVKIKLTFLGHVPYALDIKRIEKWESELFEIVKPIDYYSITKDSDGPNWQFSDECIESQLPKDFDGDILIAVTKVPIQKNYYARRVANNRICLTFHEMSDVLQYYNIPLENLIFRVLYSASLVYKRYGNRIPESHEETHFAHDETRGCIFDMNGIKSEIIYSTNRPQLCSSCIEVLKTEKIEANLLANIQKELRKIKKSFYYQVTDLIKAYPVWAIILTSLMAIIFGVIGSLLASFIYNFMQCR
jgi:hypothetical protein